MRDSQSFQNNPSNPFCSTPAESSRSITRSIIADATATALIPSRGCLGVSAGTLNPHCCTASDCSRSRAGPRSRSRAARFRDDTTYDLAAPGSIGGSLARPSKGPPRCAIVRRERERERERGRIDDLQPMVFRQPCGSPCQSLSCGGGRGGGEGRAVGELVCSDLMSRASRWRGGGGRRGEMLIRVRRIFTPRDAKGREIASLSLSLSRSPLETARALRRSLRR